MRQSRRRSASTSTDIGFDGIRPARWSAGAPYSLVPLRDLAAVGRCGVNPVAWKKAFGFDVHAAAYVFCRETAQNGHAFHARMFAPSAGIIGGPRDGFGGRGNSPATFRRFDKLADGEPSAGDRAGLRDGPPEPDRSSTLKIAGGKLTGASIGGGAVIVTEGTIEA